MVIGLQQDAPEELEMVLDWGGGGVCFQCMCHFSIVQLFSIKAGRAEA